MLRKNVTMLVSFILLATLLSLMVSAYSGSAYASSSSASASVYTTEPSDLYARAKISSSYDYDDDSHGGTTSAEAYAYASNLSRVNDYPPTQSFGSSWIGEDEVYWDYWSAN